MTFLYSVKSFQAACRFPFLGHLLRVCLSPTCSIGPWCCRYGKLILVACYRRTLYARSLLARLTEIGVRIYLLQAPSDHRDPAPEDGLAVYLLFSVCMVRFSANRRCCSAGSPFSCHVSMQLLCFTSKADPRSHCLLLRLYSPHSLESLIQSPSIGSSFMTAILHLPSACRIPFTALLWHQVSL